MSQLTVGEFIDAIEMNGLRHVTGTVLTYGGEAACALGQAYYNLWGLKNDRSGFTNPIRFETDVEVRTRGLLDSGRSLLNETIRLNDTERLSLPEIVERLRSTYADHLDVVVWES